MMRGRLKRMLVRTAVSAAAIALIVCGRPETKLVLELPGDCDVLRLRHFHKKTWQTSYRWYVLEYEKQEIAVYGNPYERRRGESGRVVLTNLYPALKTVTIQAKTEPGSRGGGLWTIYLDPEKITSKRYGRIGACLSAHGDFWKKTIRRFAATHAPRGRFPILGRLHHAAYRDLTLRFHRKGSKKVAEYISIEPTGVIGYYTENSTSYADQLVGYLKNNGKLRITRPLGVWNPKSSRDFVRSDGRALTEFVDFKNSRFRMEKARLQEHRPRP